MTSAAVIQPAPIEQTTNAAASGTVVDSAADECLRIVEDDEQQDYGNAREGEPLERRPWRSASSGERRRIHMPSATGSASISRSCPRSNGIGAARSSGRAEGQLEPPADGRNGQRPPGGTRVQSA